ncbi:MAG: hypothetical protein A3G75_06150 [Verrucomicrobia bacterium RIFCSPLOWO2_12_FULL_64_8]|nr:MAG: hypothetical protein A3G75_06150 [Verrucomicrobia bacterium RIFCSPLOWO2_12_FULL_64_8]
MNILKTLGIVAAFHAAAYFLFFITPGCRSTAPRPTPADTERPAAPSVTGESPAGTGLSASATPMETGGAMINVPSSATIRYSPTRPGTPLATALQSAPPPDVTPASTYTVVANDNLTKIAKRHGLTVTELARANKLTNNAILRIGQRLVIPGKAPPGGSELEPGAGTLAATYVVQPNDTLGAIARQAGTTTTELKRLNNLKSDYVRVGQELKLPPAGTAKPAASPTADFTAGPMKKADGAVVHVVKSGESLSDIAKRYQVKVSEIALANNIGDPNKIRQGQELVIPGFSAVGTGSTPVSTPEAATPGPTVPAAPPPGQDLETGLKKTDVPIIKVEDASAPRVP